MFFENIKLALSSMFANKMRTFLSLLGIVIGVGSVVAILNLGESASASISDSMQVGGIDMVNVIPIGANRETAILDEEFSQNFVKNVEGISVVLPTVSSSATVRYGQEIMTSSITGVTSDYFEENNLELLDGRFFSAEDNITRRQVVVLGHDIAEDLFPTGGAVGNYISIFRNQAKKYLVVGVLDEKDTTIGSSYNNVLFIPYNTYDQRFRSVSQVSSYIIKVSEGYNSIDVSNKVEDYLDTVVGSSNYTVYSPAQIVEMAGEVTTIFTSFLAAIAAISLVVGGIGIMNIMLVSVIERTREIGIRKALGATPKTIRGQFLVEAITLTLFGGIIGIIFGGFVSYVIVNAAGWALTFSWTAVVLALGFSTLVGVFFGWYPAMKASKLDPIAALSYE
ncbi:MAG: ABC transporter permease [Spirochaetales bacterium]|nr:ABC transporter permease [Spirochaetales bacterium]